LAEGASEFELRLVATSHPAEVRLSAEMPFSRTAEAARTTTPPNQRSCLAYSVAPQSAAADGRVRNGGEAGVAPERKVGPRYGRLRVDGSHGDFGLHVAAQLALTPLVMNEPLKQAKEMDARYRGRLEACVPDLGIRVNDQPASLRQIARAADDLQVLAGLEAQSRDRDYVVDLCARELFRRLPYRLERILGRHGRRLGIERQTTDGASGCSIRLNKTSATVLRRVV
jgi:hypothetical protein